ncbi:MAG TPA: 3-isopropylmalate dehydrogenase [Stellaceae bacterium]|nr:3-isopropylmalate dehydrogenase [Stellaceae bacterium]
MSNLKQVVVIDGEGIGPEVMGETRRILGWLTGKERLGLATRDAVYGAEAYRRTGKIVPDETAEALKTADAILFGATGGPAYDALPAEAKRQGNLLRVRKSLDLFANLRPIVAFPALAEASSLKNRVLEGVDFVILRELSSGLYFGEPRGIENLPNGERRGVNTHSYTSSEIRRVARFGFALARTRRSRLCSVDKANVMEAGQLWRQEVQAVHDAEFPDVELTHMLVDNCAMQIVRAPAQFDLLLTDNMFGDILSDAAAMATGSLGMLPSASFGPPGPDGHRPAFFEPVHGSAPDIAGKGVANPLGAILSLAMALRLSLGEPEAATRLERAVSEALDSGIRTRDIMHEGGRPVGTREMGDAVLAALERGAVRAR